MDTNKIECVIINDILVKAYDLTVKDVFAIMHNVCLNISENEDWNINLETHNGCLNIKCNSQILAEFFNMWKRYCREIKGYELKFNYDVED